jgi:hypothetical protein
MKTVKRCLLIAICLVTASMATAQGVRRDLTFTVGPSLLNYADLGSSPLAYNGSGLFVGAGLTNLSKRVLTDYGVTLRAGACGHANSSGTSMFFQPALHADVLFEVFSAAPARVWAGVSASDHLCIIVNEALMNASLSLSNFFSVNLAARTSITLPEVPWNGHLWTLDAAFTISPWSLVSRPGYAYVADGTASTDVLDALFGGYQSRSCFLAETSFVLGATRILSNGNRIRFGYDWQSLDSRRCTPHRYVEADHTLSATFFFNLRHP